MEGVYLVRGNANGLVAKALNRKKKKILPWAGDQTRDLTT